MKLLLLLLLMLCIITVVIIISVGVLTVVSVTPTASFRGRSVCASFVQNRSALFSRGCYIKAFVCSESVATKESVSSGSFYKDFRKTVT